MDADEEAPDKSELDYMRGQNAAYRAIMGECVRALWGDEELKAERLLLERTDAIWQLRKLCAEFGDNDWPDNLHLADIIENHLGRYLESE